MKGRETYALRQVEGEALKQKALKKLNAVSSSVPARPAIPYAHTQTHADKYCTWA